MRVAIESQALTKMHIHAVFVTALQFFFRDNYLALAGGRIIMDVLEGITNLESLNGFQNYKTVVTGGVSTLDLNGKELALALCRFFPRSAGTLSSLDIR